jgi:hypothetical protein
MAAFSLLFQRGGDTASSANHRTYHLGEARARSERGRAGRDVSAASGSQRYAQRQDAYSCRRGCILRRQDQEAARGSTGGVPEVARAGSRGDCQPFHSKLHDDGETSRAVSTLVFICSLTSLTMNAGRSNSRSGDNDQRCCRLGLVCSLTLDLWNVYASSAPTILITHSGSIIRSTCPCIPPYLFSRVCMQIPHMSTYIWNLVWLRNSYPLFLR